MMKDCPSFETWSRFSDGALDAAGDRDAAAHLGGCAACRETLASIDGIDGLLVVSLAATRASRFRLLRPAMIPVAAAALFAVAIGIYLIRPPTFTDSPLAVAEASPQAAAASAEPVRGIYCQDTFAGAQLSPLLWKTSEPASGTSALVDAPGRRALALAAHPGSKRRWALVSTASDFPVDEGVSFDVDYRISKAQKGGRMQVLLQSRASRMGRSVLRWSRTADEELLEAQAHGKAKPAVLWSSKLSSPDADWHRVKMTVTPSDVVLQRDGVEAVRKPHGLVLDRAGLTLGSTLDKRSRDSQESFECQVGRVVVQREKAR